MLVALVRSSFLVLVKPYWSEVLFLIVLLKAVFIPETSDNDDFGRNIRSPDAHRPLTLCNCDCKLLTSAVCRGLHWYTMRCVHPSQRRISSRQREERFDMRTVHTLSHACTRCLYVTQRKCVRKMCVRHEVCTIADTVVALTWVRNPDSENKILRPRRPTSILIALTKTLSPRICFPPVIICECFSKP